MYITSGQCCAGGSGGRLRGQAASMQTRQQQPAAAARQGTGPPVCRPAASLPSRQTGRQTARTLEPPARPPPPPPPARAPPPSGAPQPAGSSHERPAVRLQRWWRATGPSGDGCQVPRARAGAQHEASEGPRAQQAAPCSAPPEASERRIQGKAPMHHRCPASRRRYSTPGSGSNAAASSGKQRPRAPTRAAPWRRRTAARSRPGARGLAPAAPPPSWGAPVRLWRPRAAGRGTGPPRGRPPASLPPAPPWRPAPRAPAGGQRLHMRAL
jgi:hypothetical protein